jgi:hypothetical protein
MLSQEYVGTVLSVEKPGNVYAIGHDLEDAGRLDTRTKIDDCVNHNMCLNNEFIDTR